MVMKSAKPLKSAKGSLKNTDKKESLPNDVKTVKDKGMPLMKAKAKKK